MRQESWRNYEDPIEDDEDDDEDDLADYDPELTKGFDSELWQDRE